MTTLEQLQNFEILAQAELDALKRKADRLVAENERLSEQIDRQRATISSVAVAAERYVNEYREICHQAKQSEIAARALHICARDELMQLAEGLKKRADSLGVPVRVLEAEVESLRAERDRLLRLTEAKLRQTYKAAPEGADRYYQGKHTAIFELQNLFRRASALAALSGERN